VEKTIISDNQFYRPYRHKSLTSWKRSKLAYCSDVC